MARLPEVDPNLQPLIDFAVVDAAARMAVSVADVDVVSAEAKVWPDQSLGCPQPDMRYNQVQVEGTLIVLSVDDVPLRYHSGGGRAPFLCTART